MKSVVLVVEDDDAHRSMLETLLGSWGYSVLLASDGDEALEVAKSSPCDAVLTDVRMARKNGLEALRDLLAWNPALPVVLMTAYSSVESAVQALRLGAYDYLIKPLDFDALKKTLAEAIGKAAGAPGSRGLRRQPPAPDGAREIIGKSEPVQRLLSFIDTVAPSSATVLIGGESGTGKELIARALHAGSPRRDRPLVCVNCAALAETLLESELFGHEKGAFTGAERRRDGLFMQANGGTIFLDEIGEMPPALQARLLRVLQQGEIQRPGSDMPISVDVRVLAATNRDLREEVRQKRFREDLFFRLNVISIVAPPLRERQEDIPLLAEHFLRLHAGRNGKDIRGFSPRAMDAMLRYAWPGNVRELQNAVERGVILCASELIRPEDLPQEIFSGHDDQAQPMPDAGTSLPLDALERQAIEKMLRQTGDNKSEAARRLGITRATLHNKLRKYGLD